MDQFDLAMYICTSAQALTAYDMQKPCYNNPYNKQFFDFPISTRQMISCDMETVLHFLNYIYEKTLFHFLLVTSMLQMPILGGSN